MSRNAAFLTKHLWHSMLWHKPEGFGGNNRMNSFNHYSFNHYSFGAVGAWLYDTSLGIARDENSPGF